MGILPPRRSSRWLIWFLVYGLLLSLMMCLTRFVGFETAFDAVIAGRLILFSFGFAALANGLGWLGGRFTWLLATGGVILGSMMMLSAASGAKEGFADLAGFLSFMLLSGLGLAAGLLVDGVRLLVNRMRRTPL